MSQKLISRNPDLKRLRDEGYEVEISTANYLLIHNVPYVNSRREVCRGTLASVLTLAGERTTAPSTHVALFTGDHPCQQDGSIITAIQHAATNQDLGSGLIAKHSFSNKPAAGYPNHYEKMKRYADIISHPATSLDPRATWRTFRVVERGDEDTVFAYLDTASSRAGVNAAMERFKPYRVAIIGLGGTGAYVLDLVVKTPVREIHLFDGDDFLQHNAFRCPGAPSIEELQQIKKKVHHLRNIYSKMHTRIVAHDYHIDASNADELVGFDFVFICVDQPGAKAPIVEKLEHLKTAFIDVGMGITVIDEDASLVGTLRTTLSTEQDRTMFRKHVGMHGKTEDDGYDSNIQIADLNALNAALAVVKWKKHCGFYQDRKREFHSTYTVDIHLLWREDQNS